jgi:hypothetical protein
MRQPQTADFNAFVIQTSISAHWQNRDRAKARSAGIVLAAIGALPADQVRDAEPASGTDVRPSPGMMLDRHDRPLWTGQAAFRNVVQKTRRTAVPTVS